MDNTSVPINIRDQNKFETKAKHRVAYPEEYLNSEGLNAEVKKNFFDTLDKLKSQGHDVVAVNIDTLKYALSMYYIINTAEVSTNLSRMEGLRFGGGDVGDVRNYQELFAKNRGKFLGPEVKRRIMIGSYVLSHGYYDAFYGKALLLRDKMKKEFSEVFEKVDFICMPTAPTTAWKFGQIKDPLSLYLEDIFTVPANLAGLPAISVPTGHDSNNMPIGFQILAPYLADEKMLQFAKSITTQ
jgi:aspartyl-tRNA(Asn)/glutamyl-tRNA(Gln) amidotransferase subunit A